MTKKILILTILAVLVSTAWPALQKNPDPARLVGGGKVTQVGIVVKDIEKSARSYAQILGVPVPKWELTDPLEKAHTQYLGRPSPARAKLAFIEMPNIVIELIEPVDGPSTWRDFLSATGEGVHHIAFEVKDMNARLAEFKAQGIPLIQQGDYPGGRYAYVDATGTMGLILELLENF